MRKITIKKVAPSAPKKLVKAVHFPQLLTEKDHYLSTYEANVFPDAREALREGKFHDMFMAGDGHELEDYTDKDGQLHLAHAKSV